MKIVIIGGSGLIGKKLVARLRERGHDARAVNPWYFPNVADYRARLEKRGFVVASIALIPRPTPLPGDVTGWLETLAESFTRALPEGDRAAFLAEVQDALRPSLCDADGRWTADYVRLRFAATKPLV